jgi:hypothetical protein
MVQFGEIRWFTASVPGTSLFDGQMLSKTILLPLEI